MADQVNNFNGPSLAGALAAVGFQCHKDIRADIWYFQDNKTGIKFAIPARELESAPNPAEHVWRVSMGLPILSTATTTAAVLPATTATVSTTSLLTPKEQQARLQGVSASDVPAILGLSRGRTAEDVFNEKLGRAKPREESPFSQWGSRLEDDVADAYYERVLGQLLAAEPGARLECSKPSTYVHQGEPWALCHPDRLLRHDIPSPAAWVRDWLLECKTTDKDLAHEWGPDGSSQVPPRVEAQCRWQMFVTGCKRVDVAVLIGGNDFRAYTLTHDPAWEERVVPQMRDFWDRVQQARMELAAGQQPIAPKKELAWEEVEPQEQTPVMLEDNSLELQELLQTLQTTEQVLKEAQALKEDLRSQVFRRVGHNKGLRGVWGRLTAPTVKGRDRIDWKAVAESVKALVEPSKFMQIVQTHTRQGGAYRTLRVNTNPAKKEEANEEAA